MSLVVCQEPKYAFIHIPKSGGISLSEALLRAAIENQFQVLDHGLPYHTECRELVGHYGESWVQDACIFSVIRNPWHRLYSYWNFRRETALDRVLNRKKGIEVKQGTDDTVDRLFLNESERLGFNDWIMRQDDETDKDQVFVRRPQVSWLADHDGQLMAEQVLLLENPDLDFLVKFGVYTVPHLNKSNNQSHYVDAYSQPCRDFVQKHFEADIEIGKYRFGA